MNTFRYKTVTRTMMADLYTPVGIYMGLRDLYPQSALMECSDYHDKDNSRSFIGINPIASVSVAQGVATLTLPDSSVETHNIDGGYTVDKAIHALTDRFVVTGDDADVCGLYGYTSFDVVRYLDNINVKDDDDETSVPDMLYILYKVVIVFDHFNSQLKIVELTENDEVTLTPSLFNSHYASLNPQRSMPFRPVGDVRSTLTDDEHRENIRRGIRHCLRGDVFQIVLSRRFIQRYEGDDFRLYRALRSINPSPYLFYFDFGSFRIFGSSPETHCRIEKCSKLNAQSSTVNGQSSMFNFQSSMFKAYIDPIAGTAKRTGDSEADRKAAEYLRNDPKENAEHVMLVDLARNDLSRNCHNVKVDFYKDLQYYSHVVHLVSRVSGELDSPAEGKEADTVKAFLDTFPAGTLSGAPKVRAMQLIAEYEPHRRGPYGGCIGYIGLNGSLNQAITIRTFVSRNGELTFQAGGGIVAKSDVEYELQEVNNKLAALRKAITMADF